MPKVFKPQNTLPILLTKRKKKPSQNTSLKKKTNPPKRKQFQKFILVVLNGLLMENSDEVWARNIETGIMIKNVERTFI